MKLTLEQALAILHVHAGKVVKSPDDLDTVMRAMSLVRTHAELALIAHRPKKPLPPKEAA